MEVCLPDAVNVCGLYATNSVPIGSEFGKRLIVGQLTRTVYTFSAVQPFASVNPTSKLNCPTVVGVPEITPFADSNRPCG